MKQGFGLESADPEVPEVQNQSLLSQFDEATTLDRTQRAIGFAMCAGIGLMLSFMAPLFIFRPVKFALVYSLGNIMAVGRQVWCIEIAASGRVWRLCPGRKGDGGGEVEGTPAGCGLLAQPPPTSSL